MACPIQELLNQSSDMQVHNLTIGFNYQEDHNKEISKKKILNIKINRRPCMMHSLNTKAIKQIQHKAFLATLIPFGKQQ